MNHQGGGKNHPLCKFALEHLQSLALDPPWLWGNGIVNRRIDVTQVTNASCPLSAVGVVLLLPCPQPPPVSTGFSYACLLTLVLQSYGLPTSTPVCSMG